MNNVETQDEALNIAQRNKKSRLMKAKGKIIARKRAISMKKKSSPEKLKKKAQKKARDLIAKKMLKGKSKADLSQSGKENLEKKLDKKKALIKKIAKKILPKVKAAETERMANKKEKKESVTGTSVAEGYESHVLAILDDEGIDGPLGYNPFFERGKLYVMKGKERAAKKALQNSGKINKIPRIVGEELETERMANKKEKGDK